MILKLVIICIIILATAYTTITIATKHNGTDKKVAIPFKESIDLLKVPLVTFVNNGVKLHFLLDSGGDYSYIDSSILDLLKINSTDNDSIINISTGNGSLSSLGKVNLTIHYLEYSFDESFVVADLKNQLEAAFGKYGIRVHGVLGTTFFTKHKYELNFENMIAYSAKK